VNNPLVSVIIPNHNYGKFLNQSLCSVLEQTYKNLEIIVVNNGSTDNSLDVLKSFGSAIKIIDQHNMGQSNARNIGIRQSSGTIIALLDADDVWLPDKIERQLSLLTNEKQLIYCGIHIVNSKADVILDSVIPEYRDNCNEFFLQSPWKAIVIGGESTALFTRSLYEKVGGFNIHLTTSSGWDFFRRCAGQTNFGFSNEALLLYRQHGKNISRRKSLIFRDMAKSGYFCILDQIAAKRYFAAALFFERSTRIFTLSLIVEIWRGILAKVSR
jgi:glycosyltransferase involved in cell wall biosynthesis